MSTLTVQNIQGSSTSGNTISVASGHVLQAPGHVLQVKSAVFTDVLAISSADTRTDITNLSLSITPSSTSSKILVNTHISYGGSAANLYASGNLLRDSTAIGVNTTATGNQLNISFGLNLVGQANETYKLRNSSMTFLDSPSTTSALTYKVQGRLDANGILYINRTGQDANADYGSRGISTITVMEIAG
tara:strand:- start:219 stop:785 length:567 start_codon:yes stop_codon:yes gene_type:complete